MLKLPETQNTLWYARLIRAVQLDAALRTWKNFTEHT